VLKKVHKKHDKLTENIEEKIMNKRYLIVKLHASLLEDLGIDSAVAQVQVHPRGRIRHCV
jgi:hypothetical protein